MTIVVYYFKQQKNIISVVATKMKERDTTAAFQKLRLLNYVERAVRHIPNGS